MKRKLIALFVALAFTVSAFANTQGPLGGTGAGAGWTSAANIASTNAAYATLSIAASSFDQNLNTSSMGFSIPAGSTINGIQVDIVRHASATLSLDFGNVATLNTGTFLTKQVNTQVGTGKFDLTTWGTTDATTTLGSNSDLWGTTWAASEINFTGFGVIVGVENQNGASARTASIDSVLVTVTFTPGGSSQMFKLFAYVFPAWAPRFMPHQQTQTRGMRFS